MKNKELQTILTVIEELKENKASNKFNYALTKNKKLITNELELLRDSLPKFTDEEKNEQTSLESERVELLTKNSVKDENGNPVIENNAYKIEEDLVEITFKQIEEIKEKYKAFVTKTEELQKRDIELAEEDCNIEFMKIELDNFPELNQRQFEVLSVFIKE